MKMTQNIYDYIVKRLSHRYRIYARKLNVIALILVNIVSHWEIKGREQTR